MNHKDTKVTKEVMVTTLGVLRVFVVYLFFALKCEST